MHGHGWPCVAMCGHACMAMHVHAWQYMALRGHVWPCVAMCARTCVATYGYTWPCLADQGNAGPYMARYDHVWPDMAIYTSLTPGGCIAFLRQRHRVAV